jgi:MFS family permease
VADRRGFRACFLWGGVGFVAAPLLALAAPWCPEAFHLRLPGTEVVLNLPLVVYLLGLAAVSAACQADVVAGQRFLIGSAPPHRRISYQGFVNTLTSPLTLLPLLGAWLADAFSITAVFYLTVLGGIGYLIGACRIIPEHEAMAARDGAVPDDIVT